MAEAVSENGHSVPSKFLLSSIEKNFSFEEMSKADLISKLKEYRKSNAELLEDKRSLLLPFQEAYKMEERVKLKETGNSEKEGNTEKGNSSMEMSDWNVDVKFTDKRCFCGAAPKYAEVIKINHLWHKDYSALAAEHDKLKARLSKTERELKLARQENKDLQKIINNNEAHLNNHNTKGGLQELFTLDDIEALKQQIIIYNEDYAAEKEDNKKITEQANKVKLELQKAYGVIDSLTLKNARITDNYRRVSLENEHIINELRRLSTSSSQFLRVGSDETINSTPVTRITIGNHTGSNESLDSLHDDMNIHPGASWIHIPPSTGRIHVERDALSQENHIERKMSSPDLAYRRTFSSVHRRLSLPVTERTSPKSSPPPTDHIDFKELKSIDEDMHSL